MRKLFYCLLISCLVIVSTTPVQAATRYEVGISTSATLPWMSEAALDQRLREIKNLGAMWIRVDFNWYAIQPFEREQFHWSRYDKVVKAANRHGLKILAVVAYTAQWAQDIHCTHRVAKRPGAFVKQCNPRDKNEFAHFAATAAVRYRGQSVRAWEIWNEPNLSAYWKTAHQDNTVTVSPARYAEVANETARRIRHHYPDSVIITGGLAPLFEPHSSKGMRQSEYLAALLPRLNKWYFDGIAIHPYSWPVLPSKAADYNAFYTVDNGSHSLRAVMEKAGWQGKEIWGTEFGASTQGRRSSSHRGTSRTLRPDHVPENVQADIIREGIDLWYKKVNVGPLFVHSDSDRWLSTHKKNEGGFGLKRTDGTAKPAYNAFSEATQEVNRKVED